MSICGKFAAFACVLALTLSFAGSANGQVSSTTGAIVGTVTDNSAAVMPGVSITVSGAAMMGQRTVTTGPDGQYRIPALSPGVYTLNFSMTSFGSIVHEGINISVGFTATINATMSPAAVSQNVTVTSASPVVDLEATQVATDFSGNQLLEVTGKHDYAQVLDLTPVVTMARPSVGGSGAIAYQRSARYGMMGGDWGVVEGIAVSEGGAGGFEVPYVDLNGYGDDMSVSVIGNNAEMSQPGTFTTTVAKSGGNSFHGEAFIGYENSALETTNIDAKQIALGVTGGPGESVENTNRLNSFDVYSAGMGGYILKDKLWWYGEYSKTSLEQHFPNILGGQSQHAQLPSYMGKLTYNLNENNKLIAFYQKGTKQEIPADQSG